MSSIVPGFNYDIFISYRQNDNLDGWVTHFVKDLEQELRGTVKNPVSIYFDQNAHDGLLQTHAVDKSLESKLRALIFIPVISQTYCDPKSFAWQHEFCAFSRLIKDDQFGRDIKVTHGNVSSRFLSIRIHDLDSDDKALLETELGGPLRAVDFIYKEPGVNRPLKPTDGKQDNLYKTDYRNQVNKVANAVKELLTGMSGGHQADKPPTRVPSTEARSWRKRSAILLSLVLIVSLGAYAWFNFADAFLQAPAADRSIAVLPFENMSKDPEQDYFSNGITEDILNHLVKIADLKVKSRTSTLQYKNTPKSMVEIGEELSVKNIVEGSVRRVGNKVRIVVQLIDSETDTHIWSETYDRQIDDVLLLQSEIALEIANALKTQLSASEKENIQKPASANILAYDHYLKARGLIGWGNFNKPNLRAAIKLIDEAIMLDPDFARAYAFKGLAFFYQRYFGVSQRVWQDSALFYSSRAIAVDRNSPDGYLVQAKIYEATADEDKARGAINMAYQFAPNDPDVSDAYGYSLLKDRDPAGAGFALKALQSKYSNRDPRYFIWLGDIYRDMGVADPQEKLYLKAKSLDPSLMDPYWRLTAFYTYQNRLDDALAAGAQGDKLNPNHAGLMDALAWVYFAKGELEQAAQIWGRFHELESNFEDSTQMLPFRRNLGLVYREMGRKKDGDALVKQDLRMQLEILSGERSIGALLGLSAVYYDVGADYAYLGQDELALKYLDSAQRHGFYHYEAYFLNPVLTGLRGHPEFERMKKVLVDYREFNKTAFTRAFAGWQGEEEMNMILK
jgi:TolB-like protein